MIRILKSGSWFGVVLFIGLVVSACGVEGTEPGTEPETTVTVTTDAPATTQTSSPPSTLTLPGEPIDFGPEAGSVMGVVGVAHDDVLNVREVPGVGGRIIAELEALAEDVQARGEARLLPGSIWIKVEAGGTEGWVNISYLAFLGATDDATAEIVDTIGSRPSASDMEELGLLATQALASEDPASVITMTAAPTLADLGEVTYDVIGLGDDAVYGLRLHVFGEAQGGRFSLHSVERTWLCARGVTDDGVCV